MNWNRLIRRRSKSLPRIKEKRARCNSRMAMATKRWWSFKTPLSKICESNPSWATWTWKTTTTTSGQRAAPPKSRPADKTNNQCLRWTILQWTLKDKETSRVYKTPPWIYLRLNYSSAWQTKVKAIFRWAIWMHCWCTSPAVLRVSSLMTSFIESHRLHQSL